MIDIIIFLLLYIVFGAICCFLGKKLYFPVIMLSTFVMSSTFCLNYFGCNWKGILFGIISGGVLAFIVRFVYKVGVFLLGAFLGLTLGLFILSVLPESIGSWKWIIVSILALVIGILSLKWCDFFIILGTSLQGASMIASAGCFLYFNAKNLEEFVYADGTYSTITHLQDYLNNNLVQQEPILLLSMLAILALLGFIVQLCLQRNDS